MCRNIKTLYNFDPPATSKEIKAASLQFVRKVSGFQRPSKVNQVIFEQAVEEVAKIAGNLISGLTTETSPRNREIEAAKAKERAAKR
jgi:hypothetical protein